jgi:glucose/arabinose dehydrogenase
MKILFYLLSALLLILALAGVKNSYAQVEFVNAYPNRSFSQPIFLTHAGDATNRVFVAQQNGLIVVFPNDSTGSSINNFLNVTDKILSGGERGLLGLAFHPNYASNRYFYVNYTRAGDGATIVSRFQTQSGNPNKADSLSELVLLTIQQPFSNHNGGIIFFGLDGFLYIGMGDGGSGGDPGNRAQDTSQLLGKVLRIDVNNPSGGNNYGIPPGNPYPNGTRPEIFAIGLRNPWRMSQDHVTGILYCGDVGQGCWEEISIITAGANLGWKIMEGFYCYVDASGTNCLSTSCNTSGLTLPVKQYANQTAPECSVTGGYVYRGSRIPWLVGRYVYADYCSRKLWKLLYSGGNLSDTSQIGTAPSQVLSFGTDQNNELYVLCANGIVYKLLNTVIGINSSNSGIPEGYSLEQNYPNPFNPVTTIKYSVPENSFVTLNVYDLTGKEVETLFNGSRLPGSYSAVWNARNFSSGVYFYTLTAGSVSIEKKMVIIK